jgi:tight adherence protein C
MVAIITQTMNTSLIIAFILNFLWAAEKFLKYNSAKKNMSTVRRDLPLLLDFLVLQVESGHSIQQALNYASQLFPEHSPVHLSLNKFQENIRLGSSIQAALLELAEFLDTTNSRTAFHTISQAIKHGTPLGGVLRNQANRMREQLVIEGEKFAQTISIKLLIPLLFFIFPASFLVIFSPVIVSITRIPR